MTIPGFEDVYLEDSWVLAVRAEPGSVVLDIECVLLRAHPFYSPPAPGQQHSYRRGALRFSQVAAVSWTEQDTVTPSVDASGEHDLGSVDEFEVHDGSYLLMGDFGRLEIWSARPVLELSGGIAPAPRS